MSEQASDNAGSNVSRITWKQGMSVALGVPLLILPSLCDISSIVWGLCILVWTFSVLQGFVQNIAYGEMVTVFPKATGLPGCAQTVFTPVDQSNPRDIRKFFGAFSAWCYWFAWCPVVAIFTMLIGDYLVQMFELTLSGYAYWGLYLAVGVCIVALMLVLGSRGLDGGAKMSAILAVLSIVPIVAVLIGAYINGMFHFENIANNLTPIGWSWSAGDIVLLFGCFGLAQWSACAWETAAIYGPEYENPGKDVPKALFGCGLICLALFFFISFSIYGDLGPAGMASAGAASVVPIADHVLGKLGASVALLLLIVAMVLIIQTGFLGSSRTLESLAREGNLPKWFGELNEHGQPIHAMIFVSIFNLALVTIIGFSGRVLDSGDTNMTILSASAMGYAIANGIALAAFVKSRTDSKFRDLPRPFAAPKKWHYVIAAFVVLQFCVWLPCLVYWSYYLSGSVTSAAIGAVCLMVFVPLWYVVQGKAKAN